MFTRGASIILISALLLPGCAEPTPANPSFPITYPQARQAIDEMAAHPKPLARPVVIIGGYHDPYVSPPYVAAQIRKLTPDAQTLGAAVGFYATMEDCRQHVIDAVDQAYPSTDPVWTTEVDVIGLSLGGLIGRYAAAASQDSQHPRRLRIARLLTVSSPHSGASLAEVGAFTQLERDLHPKSDFMKYVAACDASATYQLIPYARLGDSIVGEQYAAPPGQIPFWLATPATEGGHSGAWTDVRILADIARRLRDEPPFTREPRTPLPK